MRPRERYVRKHVHTWKICKKTPATKASSGGWSFYGFNDKPTEATLMKLERSCDDCGAKQSCEVPDESVLLPGYEAISDDVEWK